MGPYYNVSLTYGMGPHMGLYPSLVGGPGARYDPRLKGGPTEYLWGWSVFAGKWHRNFGELHWHLMCQCLPHITMFYIFSVTYIIFIKYKVMMVQHDGRGVGISANVTGTWCTDGFNISPCFPYCSVGISANITGACFFTKYFILMQFALNHCCTGQHWRKHKVMMLLYWQLLKTIQGNDGPDDVRQHGNFA
ncbi:hypothetical protein EDD22DRAFT_851943 [Suillus occidentalis]|nr:hypothetical protein EDD22DRAFT_851943 [Suillus occidentalis]